MVLFLLSWVLLFFLAFTRLGVYTVMIAGWSSNSGYSLLRGLRALAQIISYEVRLASAKLCCLLKTIKFICTGSEDEARSILNFFS